MCIHQWGLVLIKFAQHDNKYHHRGARQAILFIVSEINQVSGKQLAAARALLGIGQVDLAKAANISAPTLRRMEASAGEAEGMRNNVAAVVRALEERNVEFIEGGVRLRDRQA
jgi:hypothetical protein